MMSLVPVERRTTRGTSSRRSSKGPSLFDRLLEWLRGGRVTSARARRCRAAQVPRPARAG
jgi:hypothetical protein